MSKLKNWIVSQTVLHGRLWRQIDEMRGHNTIAHPLSSLTNRFRGFVADDPEETDEEYRSVRCLACAQTHFVNSKTGQVLGGDVE
jgi:hypothetical protein